MPRLPRIFQRSLCYHIMNRGVNRNALFADEKDRAYFSKTVAEYKAICGARIYHWAWMGNHYHMLVEVVHANLSAFAGGLQQAFAQYHHARHDGTGVFWQGRFKSKPVEIGPYLVSCGRYIERNPVRAGMVEQAWDYRWSSAARYVNKVDDGVTDENPYLGTFDDNDRKLYAEALMAGTDDDVVRTFEGDRAIGSKPFASTLKRERGRQRIKRGRPYKKRVN